MLKENWRPKDWENHYDFMTGGAIPTYEKQSQAFEAGADAMLGAVKAEYGLQLFTLLYNEMPVILKDGQQVLIGIKLEEKELPAYLSAFTSRGDYTLGNLIITGKPLVESDIVFEEV